MVSKYELPKWIIELRLLIAVMLRGQLVTHDAFINKKV